MKKLTLISICLLLFTGLIPDKSNARTDDEFKKSYVTTEDIMLQIIKPDVKQILRDKYGEELVDWQYSNKEILDLKLVHEQFEPKWFEVTASVEYQLKKTDGLADITLKMVPPAFSRDKEITEIEIKLIDLFIAERVK